MADVEGIDAGVIAKTLHAKHGAPEWATFSELRDSTGFGQSRTIDVAAFNTWKSSRHIRIAYEIKVSRGDFIKELDQPQKHAWVEKYFHETYFAAPAGLIKPDEVPAHWGLLEVYRRKGGVVTTRRSVRAKRRAPDDFHVGLTMSILRRAADQVAQARGKVYEFDGETVTPEDVDRMVAERVEPTIRRQRESLERMQGKVRDEHDKARRFVQPVEYLLREAGKFYHPQPDVLTDLHVSDLINDAAARRLESYTESIERARSALEALAGVAEKAS